MATQDPGPGRRGPGTGAAWWLWIIVAVIALAIIWWVWFGREPEVVEPGGPAEVPADVIDEEPLDEPGGL